MHSSAATIKLAPALTKALADLKNPTAGEVAKVKSKKTGVEFSYKYPAFDKIVNQVREVLALHDLTVVQEAMSDNQGRVGVTTRIVHSSGEWLEFGPLYLPAGEGPQDYGSALTYALRYALTSALLLAAEEDNDAASVKAPRTSDKGSTRAPAAQPRPGPNVEEAVGISAVSGSGDPLADPERASSHNVGSQDPKSPARGRQDSEGPGAPDPDPTKHKFRGDPAGACLLCGWFAEAHSERASA
jgi:hypothetical protein